MTKISLDTEKLRKKQNAELDGHVQVHVENGPQYSEPTFATDQSGSSRFSRATESDGVDIYPEEMDQQTAQIVQDF